MISLMILLMRSVWLTFFRLACTHADQTAIGRQRHSTAAIVLEEAARNQPDHNARRVHHFMRSNVFCSSARSLGLAQLFAGLIDPLLLECVLRWAVVLIKHAEDAGEG